MKQFNKRVTDWSLLSPYYSLKSTNLFNTTSSIILDVNFNSAEKTPVVKEKE
jgi:hypothetical protein